MAKSKKEMVEFLKNHFRYDTMNSWNASTSYAANVKLRNLDIPRDLMDKAYEIIEQGDVYESIREIIAEFEDNHNYAWQVGFNGRSGGYMVLYQGGKYENGQTFSYPGKGLDMGEDFEGWSRDDVLERYKLVREFDKLVKTCREEFLYYCKNYSVEEETIMVSKKVKVLHEVV